LGFSTVNMIWISYHQQRYDVGASGLGIADAALGVGRLVSGFLLGKLAKMFSKTMLNAGGMIFIGTIYMTILLLPSFGWIISWQFLCGLALTPMQSALDTILQLAIPDLKRGRVGSVVNSGNNAAGVVSMSLAAIFREAMGLEVVFLVVGSFVLAAGLQGFWLLRLPEERLVGQEA
jgi:MFS family permease